LPTGVSFPATLTVNSQLPGGAPVGDGIELSIAPPFVNMLPHGGAALFHVEK
jgi:hypothetical protein